MHTRSRSFTAALAALSLVVRSPSAAADRWPNITIPANNAASLRSAPARPAPGDVSDRARHLVEALNSGNSDGALDFFLPLDPFLAIKDMSGAAGYHARLIREYRRDIETYRSQLPRGQRVEFVRFDPSRSCTWMAVGREWNRLPYWSCYGSRLVVRANNREISLRVNVLIHWGDRWYVTHLDRIRH